MKPLTSSPGRIDSDLRLEPRNSSLNVLHLNPIIQGTSGIKTVLAVLGDDSPIWDNFKDFELLQSL